MEDFASILLSYKIDLGDIMFDIQEELKRKILDIS